MILFRLSRRHDDLVDAELMEIATGGDSWAMAKWNSAPHIGGTGGSCSVSYDLIY